jgi:hypothetical protein
VKRSIVRIVRCNDYEEEACRKTTPSEANQSSFDEGWQQQAVTSPSSTLDHMVLERTVEAAFPGKA